MRPSLKLTRKNWLHALTVVCFGIALILGWILVLTGF